MRNIFLLLSMFCVIGISAQDKIYLNDNSIIEGKITAKKDKSVKILLANQSEKSFCKNEIAVIIYESGYSEVISEIKKDTKNKKKEFGYSEWMIGTNILQPLAGEGGFLVEKNFTKNYSVRIGQSFNLNRYYGFEARTSILNQFYLGKGRVKWMNSAGINIIYDENPYYYGCFPTDDCIVMDMFAPYPQQGFNTNLSAGFSFGTGMYLDITKHLAFSVQYQLTFQPYQWGWNVETDLTNSGFTFFYKF